MMCLCGLVLLGVGTMPLVAEATATTPQPPSVQSSHPSVAGTVAAVDPQSDDVGAEAVVVLGALMMLLAGLTTRSRVRPE